MTDPLPRGSITMDSVVRLRIVLFHLWDDPLVEDEWGLGRQVA